MDNNADGPGADRPTVDAAAGEGDLQDAVARRLAEWAERDATIGLRREVESLRARNEQLEREVDELRDAEVELSSLRREMALSASGRLWLLVATALRSLRAALRRL